MEYGRTGPRHSSAPAAGGPAKGRVITVAGQTVSLDKEITNLIFTKG